jgi:nitrous oxide reductase
LNGKILAIMIIAVAGTLGGGVMTLVIGLPSSPCAGITGSTRSFTIMASSNGYNDSKTHQGSWPIMSVNRCDTVAVKVVNTDTQSHGFAIDYYAVKGMEIQGQQSQSVTFLASRTGHFRAYCIVPCSIHIAMQNGLLAVS